MKMKLFSIFLVILIFSNFCLSTGFTQDIALQAKLDAERDAAKDVSKPFWFGVGLATSVLAPATLGVAGCLVGGTVAPQDPGIVFIAPTDSEAIGFLIGTAIGYILPSIILRSWAAQPPVERFLGKPTGYIEPYTKAYTSKVKSIRASQTLLGVGAGVLGTGCLLMMAITD